MIPTHRASSVRYALAPERSGADGLTKSRVPRFSRFGPTVGGQRSSRGDFRRIGLYDAYLSTLGGGENFLAVLAEFLEEEFPSAEIEIVTHEENRVPIDAVAQRFGVELRRTRIRALRPNPRSYLARLKPVRRVLHERDIARISSEYDLFVNNTIFSLTPPRSPFSVYMCMFPLDPKPWWLEREGLRSGLLSPYTALRRTLYKRWIGAYTLVLANSDFTKTWIRRFWGLDARVLYPPIETRSEISLTRKGRGILALGRFFPGDHNKKHDVLIEAFSGLFEAGLEGWKLHLVGGRTRVAGTDAYIERLKKQAAGLPVEFHFDASRAELEELLETCSIFWHATGYGEDAIRKPEKLEHFGMSTVEAMTHGCVPVVYACGGQPEIIEQGRSGFLWTSLKEFRKQTMRLIDNSATWEEMARHAHQRSQCFSKEAFRDSVRELLSKGHGR